MWALMVPSPNGTSWMIWFMRTLTGISGARSLNSARIRRASASHSSLRNGYWAHSATPVRVVVGPARRHTR